MNKTKKTDNEDEAKALIKCKNKEEKCKREHKKQYSTIKTKTTRRNNRKTKKRHKDEKYTKEERGTSISDLESEIGNKTR